MSLRNLLSIFFIFSSVNLNCAEAANSESSEIVKIELVFNDQYFDADYKIDLYTDAGRTVSDAVIFYIRSANKYTMGRIIEKFEIISAVDINSETITAAAKIGNLKIEHIKKLKVHFEYENATE